MTMSGGKDNLLPPTTWELPKSVPGKPATLFSRLVLYHLRLDTARSLPGLLEYTHRVYATLIEAGRTHSFEATTKVATSSGDDVTFKWVYTRDEFEAFFWAADVFIAIGTNADDGSDPALVGDVEATRAGRSWEEILVGFYYIRPNHQGGRTSHNCNSGLVVSPPYRQSGYGKTLDKSKVHYIPLLGYKASIGRVFATNTRSIRLCESSGFTRVGLIPRSVRLRRADGDGEEWVDCVIYYRSYVDEEEWAHSSHIPHPLPMSAYGTITADSKKVDLLAPTTWELAESVHCELAAPFSRLALHHLRLDTARSLPGLLEYMHQVFATEVEAGRNSQEANASSGATPESRVYTRAEFEAYFWAADVVIAIGTNTDNEAKPVLVEDVEVARAGRSWEDTLVGFYYVKPNFIGNRTSHICNAAGVVSPPYRQFGYGKTLAKSFLHYAPSLGYKACIIHVFATNTRSMRICESLGLTRAGHIPRVGRLRRADGSGEEWVDSIVYYRSFVDEEEWARPIRSMLY